MARHLKYWLPVYLYAGLIFFLSSISLPRVPAKIPFLDKIAHFFEYAFLSFLLYRACVSSLRGWLNKHRDVISVAGAILYAFSDELHQFFVPGRQMSQWDFLFDALGAIVAVVILKVVYRLS